MNKRVPILLWQFIALFLALVIVVMLREDIGRRIKSSFFRMYHSTTNLFVPNSNKSEEIMEEELFVMDCSPSENPIIDLIAQGKWEYVMLPGTNLSLSLPKNVEIKEGVVIANNESTDRNSYFAFNYSVSSITVAKDTAAFLKDKCAGLFESADLDFEIEQLSDQIEYGYYSCEVVSQHFLRTKNVIVFFTNSTDESNYGLMLYKNALKSAALQ